MSKYNVCIMKDAVYQILIDNITETTKALKNKMSINDLLKQLNQNEYVDNWYIKFNDLYFDLDSLDSYSKKIFSVKKEEDYYKVIYENCVKMYNAFKNIPRFIITNPNFWYWFEFDLGYNFGTSIMAEKDGINGTWLSIDNGKIMSRNRTLAYNIISRYYFATLPFFEDGDRDVAKFVIGGTLERFRRILFNNIGNNKSIYIGIVKGEYKFYKDYIETDITTENKNNAYFGVAKHIYTYGGAHLVDLLSVQEVEEKSYEYLKAHYDINK